MTRQFIFKTTLLILYILECCTALAQQTDNSTTINTKITTEGEYNFKNKKGNLASLLDVCIESPSLFGFSLHGELLSANNLRLMQDKENIVEDKQGFSNILLAEESLPLSLFKFGVRKQFSKRLSAFVGVNNLNADYFISDYTSLFTGSACGIYPTLSDNWSLGNYPYSAFCFHLEWKIYDRLTLKNSLYNGKASMSWDKLFSFRPKSDGLTNISQISYQHKESLNTLSTEYHLGLLWSNSYEQNHNSKQKSNYSLFALVEQPLYEGDFSLGLLMQGGLSTKNLSNTYAYYGAGIVSKSLFDEEDCMGIMINCAFYSLKGNETDVELTYSFPLSNTLTLKPAIHFITSNNQTNTVGLLRLNVEL